MSSNGKANWSYLSDLDAFELYHKVRESSTSSDELALLPALRHALAGGVGSAISNIAVYPLDLVVTRLQVQRRSPSNKDKTSDDSRYNGVRDAIHKIYTNEGGIRAFYTGVSSDTFKSAADSFFFFLAYNLLLRARKRYAFSKNRLIQSLDEIALGVVAGAITKALTTPIQIVVTHKQTRAMVSADKSSDNKPHAYGRQLSARDILEDIYKQQGVAGLWSGYSASIVLTLNPSITFFVDSLLQRLLRVGEKPSSIVTFLLAATGKATASTIMYPVSLAKARAQAKQATSNNHGDSDGEKAEKDNSQKQKPSPASVLSTIPQMAREDGVSSLYAGVWGEVLKGFFSHGLTMMVKQRIYTLVIRLALAVTAMLKRQSLAT